MMISSSTSRSLFAALLSAALLVPGFALAAVKITDALYDPPGADLGHEWIQITNTGTNAVNIAGYRLYEGGTNHKLTVAIGTSSLAAGAVAIITTDPAQYQAEHPLFAGAVFKSSFSLSNTSETIALKDPLLKVADTYSYTAPPVAKEAAPVKTPKGKTTPVSTNKLASNSYAGSQAAVSLAQLPMLPSMPNAWLYSLGLIAILLLGAAAALYARPPASGAVTGSAAEEFELE